MCLSAHNYPTFGLTGHIITRVLDQSTLKNLQCESAHVLLAHNYVRFGLILRDLVCTSLKSAKNLYLRYRFFDKIRQIHRFFDVFRQKLQILCRNQARGGRAPIASRRALIARQLTPLAWRETRLLAALSHKKPGIHTKWIPGRNRSQPAREPHTP